MNVFQKWFYDIFSDSDVFMPDAEWQEQHERINEDPNIIDEPLAEALKDENESRKG